MMKFKRLLALSSTLLLSSCQANLAIEWVNRPPVSKTQKLIEAAEISSTQALFSKMVVDFGFATANKVVSPLGFFLTECLKNGDEGSLSEYKALTEKANVKTDRFSISSLGAFASTAEIDKPVVEKYSANFASVFQGSIAELENSLKKFFGFEVKLGNPGEYYMNSLELTDNFALPIEESANLPFAGSGSHYFTIKKYLGSYLDGEDFFLVDLPVNNTSLRLLLPKDGIDIASINFEQIFNDDLVEGKIKAKVPEFKLKDFYLKLDSDRYISQGSEFEFSRYGVKGKAFTVNGPTSTGPEHDFEITFDRPFFFASMYKGMPLFCGSVVSL